MVLGSGGYPRLLCGIGAHQEQRACGGAGQLTTRETWPGRILQDTGALVGSLTGRYDGHSAVAVANLPYPAKHKLGHQEPAEPRIPARSDDLDAEITDTVVRHFAEALRGGRGARNSVANQAARWPFSGRFCCKFIFYRALWRPKWLRFYFRCTAGLRSCSNVKRFLPPTNS